MLSCTSSPGLPGGPIRLERDPLIGEGLNLFADNGNLLILS